MNILGIIAAQNKRATPEIFLMGHLIFIWYRKAPLNLSSLDYLLKIFILHKTTKAISHLGFYKFEHFVFNRNCHSYIQRF